MSGIHCRKCGESIYSKGFAIVDTKTKYPPEDYYCSTNCYDKRRIRECGDCGKTINLDSDFYFINDTTAVPHAPVFIYFCSQKCQFNKTFIGHKKLQDVPLIFQDHRGLGERYAPDLFTNESNAVTLREGTSKSDFYLLPEKL